MNTSVATMVQEAAEHWPHVAPLLVAPQTKKQYERLVAALDKVLDAGGADEGHVLAGLADCMGDLVAAYEDKYVAGLGLADGVDVIRHFMEVKKLRQCDLPEIGSQSIVSEVLNRKRNLNARQIRELSRRFGVSMEVFAARE